MTSASLHLVVTCANRKRSEVPPELALRQVPPGSVLRRHSDWLERLIAHQAATMRATDLYVGDHWSHVRRITSQLQTRGLPARVWVASAGYGLVPLDAPLRPYGVTFSPNHPDSVVNHSGLAARTELGLWWELMSEWEGPAPGEPRTLEELVVGDSEARLVAVASESYLNALTGDLGRAAALAPGRVSTVAAVSDADDGLGETLIPYDARARDRLSGNLTSLLTRYVSRALDELGPDLWSPARFRWWAREFLSRCAEVPMPQRDRVSDGEVLNFVRLALAKDPSQSCTRLHRRFRDNGRACEQGRFKQLFHQVKEACG